MGSINASGISVVAKTSTTFRKRPVLITKTDSTDDTVTTEAAFNDSLHRAIGSGSIVRDDGSVNYSEELVLGAYLQGRNSDARIASADSTRVRTVELEGVVVIPTGFGIDGVTAQIGVKHEGERLMLNNSMGDTVSRVSNSGSYS